MANRVPSSNRAPSKSLYLPGRNGNYASTPHATALNVTGNIDLRVYAKLFDYYGTRQNFIAKWGAGTNQRSYQLGVDVLGAINFQVTTDGTAATIKTMSASYTWISGTPGWFRATLNPTTGAWVLYTSIDGITWTSRGSGTTTGGPFTIFASDAGAPLEIGTLSIGTSIPMQGNVYYADVRNNILNDGTGIVASPDFRTATASGFSDTQGNVWTVNTSGSPIAKLVSRINVTHAAVSTPRRQLYPSFVHIEGFDNGSFPSILAASNSQYAAINNTGTLMTHQTATTHSGGYAIKVLADGVNTGSMQKNYSGTGTVGIARFAFYAKSWPNGLTNICLINSSNSIGGPRISNTGVMDMSVRGSVTLSGSSTTLSLNTWYLVDVFGSTDSSGTYTVKTKVTPEGGATIDLGTTIGTGNAGTTVTSCLLGPSTVRTSYELYFDDWLMSDSGNDYPLDTTYKVAMLDPDPTGSTTFTASVTAHYFDETASAIATGTALSHLDSTAPWEAQIGSTPPTKFIQQTNAGAADIVEFDFKNTTANNIYGVQLIGAVSRNVVTTTPVSIGAVRSDTTAFSTTVTTGNATIRNGVLTITPPTAGWNNTQVNAIRGRLLGSAATGSMWESMGLNYVYTT